MEERFVRSNSNKTIINGNNISFFYEGLALASQFYNKMGNLAVSKCCVSGSGRTLGLWVEECRRNLDILNYSQISDLLSMGFYVSSEVLEHQKNWMECYNKVKSLYKYERGGVVLPDGIDEKFGFDVIGWLESQKKYRYMHSNMFLTSRQIALLNELNYDWGTGFEILSDDSSILRNNMLMEIEAVKEELVRHREVVKRYTLEFYKAKCDKLEDWNRKITKILRIKAGQEETNKEIYEWISSYLDKDAWLTKEQRLMFSALDIKKPIPEIYLPKEMRDIAEKAEEDVKAYIAKQKSIHDYKSLVHRTNESKRKHWIYNEDNYKKGLEVCKSYMSEGRSYLIEPHGNKTAEYSVLREFLTAAREAYSRGILNSEKIEDLNKLNMVWDEDYSNGDRISYFWMGMFLEHQNYFNKNGKLLVHNSSMISSDGRKMGPWISSQRRAYKSDKLNATQIDLLRSINIIKSK